MADLAMQLPNLSRFALAVCMFGASRHASAQAAGFSMNRFEPSERGSDWFVSDSLDLRGAANVAGGAVYDYSYRPLVLRAAGSAGAPSFVNVVTDQLVMHSGAALTFRDRFRLALNLPLVLYQQGDDVSAVAHAVRAPRSASVGDLRFSGDVRLLNQYGAVFSAAAGVQVYVPTGSRALLTSDGTFRVTPRVLIAGDGDGFLYAAKLGYAYRPFTETFEGRSLGSEVIFSLAGGVRVNDIFVFGPELYGSTGVTRRAGPFTRRGTPLELLLGLHLTVAKNWQVGSAIGPGLTQGDGTPSMRVVFSLELAPDVCVDTDGDGICANVDACPEVDGVRSSLRSTNGCPQDSDHDGVTDKEDACLDRAGVPADDAAKNGCPRGIQSEPPKAVEPH